MKPFADWTDDDWANCGISALWRIEEGRVLWADGAWTREEMLAVGVPYEEFEPQIPGPEEPGVR